MPPTSHVDRDFVDQAADQLGAVVLARARDQKWGPINPQRPGRGYRIKEGLLDSSANARHNLSTILRELTHGGFHPKR
jgi:hypothetical protein